MSALLNGQRCANRRGAGAIMRTKQYNVGFISCEIGDDLIISFAIEGQDPIKIRSLTLLRTPKYEHLLFEGERGVSASFEQEDGNIPDEINLLMEAIFSKKERMIKIKTQFWIKELDLKRVDDADLDEMQRVFEIMNADRSFLYTQQ